MGANKPIEDIEATLLAATKSALRGAFAPTGSLSSGFNIGGPRRACRSRQRRREVVVASQADRRRQTPLNG
jgi:hypothetical protein